MPHRISTLLVAACALCAVTACSQDASTTGNGNATASSSSAGASASTAANPTTASAGSTNWIANGATACDKYLTPDAVAAILTHPAGHTEKLGAQACTYVTDYGGNISITLVNGGPSVFDAHQKYLVKPLPLPGVGDKASRSAVGIEAVKGADRMCTIDDGAVVGDAKLKDEALAEQLGEICNKLFALP